MRLETSRRQVPTINVSALVDVVFTLLIFLLLAATFSPVGRLDVALPEAKAAPSGSVEGVLVLVPLFGHIEINDVEVEEDELVEALTSLRHENEALLLVADGTVALQRAVKVLDAAGQAGFSTISIATKSSRDAVLDQQDMSLGEDQGTATDEPLEVRSRRKGLGEETGPPAGDSP